MESYCDVPPPAPEFDLDAARLFLTHLREGRAHLHQISDMRGARQFFVNGTAVERACVADTVAGAVVTHEILPDRRRYRLLTGEVTVKPIAGPRGGEDRPLQPIRQLWCPGQAEVYDDRRWLEVRDGLIHINAMCENDTGRSEHGLWPRQFGPYRLVPVGDAPPVPPLLDGYFWMDDGGWWAFVVSRLIAAAELAGRPG